MFVVIKNKKETIYLMFINLSIIRYEYCLCVVNFKLTCLYFLQRELADKNKIIGKKDI